MTDKPGKHPDHTRENPEADPDSNPEEYKVGPGKPPKDTRFKPGHSGNPSGKRKRGDTCEDLLKEEMDRLIAIRENGKTVTLSKRKAFVKAVVNGAIQGNLRDEKILMMFEKPSETPRRGELKFIEVDSEDDIPPR